jgi:hypothetical protein
MHLRTNRLEEAMTQTAPNPPTHGGAPSPATAGASGNDSNSAITMLAAGESIPESAAKQLLAAKLSRARMSGPRHITANATVAEMDSRGNMVVLHQGTNQWTCFPGNENEIGNVPMCADPMGLQWMMDVKAHKPAPTNTAPGLIYMLCGATQHSNTDPFDKTSPAVPIGPHWMILWPFDAGVMFDTTPYAYLHICGTPWVGNEYTNDCAPLWTMQYGASGEPRATT